MEGYEHLKRKYRYVVKGADRVKLRKRIKALKNLILKIDYYDVPDKEEALLKAKQDIESIHQLLNKKEKNE